MLSLILLVPLLIESVPVDLTTQVGQNYNARAMLLHKLVIEPANLGLHLALPDLMPLDRPRAQSIAAEAGKQLRADGYPDAEVNYSLTPFAGHLADLHLVIAPGERVRVKQVRFEGAPGLDPKELRGALRALHIRRVLFWHLFPAYSAEAVDSDLTRLRSLYLSKGFYDASIRPEDHKSQLSFFIDSGSRSQVRGPACACLLQARREAERQGILDFAVAQNVDGSTEIQRGQPYRVGRIRFIGNHHYSDATLRRNLLLDEGQLLDETLLRKSLDRLNRSLLFEPITEKDAAIYTNEAAATADVTIHVRERKRGAWNISGPVGPASLAGPLHASISSRLPPRGSGLFELSTYAVSISMFAFARPIVPLLAVNPKHPLLPVLALARPFSPAEGWKSGFVVPQLGWRASALSYAVSQTQQRLLPKSSGIPGLPPELPVTVTGASAGGLTLCEPPRPRFAALRTAAAFALGMMGTFAGF